MFNIQYLLISLPVILITISIHEFAHAKVADMLGDPTPRLAGRLTLNPISHIDPIGFLMLLLFRFGWAKPVPINPYNFADSRRGSAVVGLAGPLSNFFTAWVLATAIKFLPFSAMGAGISDIILAVASYAIWINIALAVFNLIPIPPLDGSHILEAVLPAEQAASLQGMAPYGFMILVMILLFGPTQDILALIINSLYGLLLP